MQYPKISDETIISLKIIRNGIATEGADYLARSPYSKLIVGFLEDVMMGDGFGGGDRDTVENIFAGEGGIEETAVVDEQVQILLSRLAGMSTIKMETNEKLQLFKTQAALLEKLISIRERTAGIREVNEFKALVIKGLEEVCNVEQINELYRILGTGGVAAAGGPMLQSVGSVRTVDDLGDVQDGAVGVFDGSAR